MGEARVMHQCQAREKETTRLPYTYPAQPHQSPTLSFSDLSMNTIYRFALPTFCLVLAIRSDDRAIGVCTYSLLGPHLVFRLLCRGTYWKVSRRWSTSPAERNLSQKTRPHIKLLNCCKDDRRRIRKELFIAQRLPSTGINPSSRAFA